MRASEPRVLRMLVWPKDSQLSTSSPVNTHQEARNLTKLLLAVRNAHSAYQAAATIWVCQPRTHVDTTETKLLWPCTCLPKC